MGQTMTHRRFDAVTGIAERQRYIVGVNVREHALQERRLPCSTPRAPCATEQPCGARILEPGGSSTAASPMSYEPVGVRNGGTARPSRSVGRNTSEASCAADRGRFKAVHLHVAPPYRSR